MHQASGKEVYCWLLQGGLGENVEFENKRGRDWITWDFVGQFLGLHLEIKGKRLYNFKKKH